MKNLNRHFIALIMLLFTVISLTANAQQDEKALLKEGIQLHDKGKYADAITKYEAALKLNPNFLQAEFEMAYSLYAAGKGQEAVPHLQKVVNSPNDIPLAAQATDILGSIYDDSGQPDKAIEVYQKGIKLDPKYQRLRYNLALAYLRQKKYAEAEANAIEAIKLDPKHASSQNVYATAALGQNKAPQALLGLCSFLMLEPQTKRSAEAYQQIDHIMKVMSEQKNMTVVLDKDGKEIDPMSMLNMSINLGASGGKALGEKGVIITEQLDFALNTIFKTAAREAEKVKNKDFFWNFYASYLGGLSKTGNMPAFVRLINLSANREENLKWFKDNPDKLKALQDWQTKTERSF